MIKLLLKHEGETREMELSQTEISMGRSAENTIALNDKKASRKHAKIEKDGDTYRLVDLGSGNGTKVNGKDVNMHVLGLGDEVQIGLSTVTVIALDAPSLIRHAPASAAPAAAAADAKPAESLGDALKKHTRRGHYARKSSSGSMVAFAAAALVIGAVAWVLYEKAGNISVRPAAGTAEKKGDSLAREAETTYASFRPRAESETASDALIAEASTLAEKFGHVKPDFDVLVTQLKQRRAEQIGKMAFSQVEGLVQAALKERRFGDALDALKALKGTPDAAQAAILADKATEEIGKEFKIVDEQGKKLAAEKQYSAAAEHYRTQAKSFRATEHFKYLSNKPEMLDELAKTEIAAETAKAQRAAAPPKETAIAKAPAPAPEPPKPVVEAPKPAMPKEPPKPAMPAPPAPKPAVPAPKPPEPKPAAPKPPEPKPEPKEDAKPAEGSTVRYKKPDVLCDCKKVLKGTYCVKCERTLMEDDLRKGLCKKCEEKPKKIDLCVKRYFQAECHPEKISDKPVLCDGKVYDFPHEDKARIVHLCEACDEWGETQSEIKHKAECKNRLATTKVCQKSGQGAHAPKEK